ncbi:MAG: uncharacterized protein JWN13_2989, partial [Betaproteobacteria bacterium]|nr:uncharacterized protein [Betaproteobacteria bacterium]
MIHIRGRFATYGELWFDEQPPGAARVDVLMFRQRSSPLAGRVCLPFLSLVNDLSAAEQTLMAGLGKTNRYKIKRAASKDELSAEWLADPQAQLDSFVDFYDEFAREKGLQAAYRRGLDAACASGHLVLSHASKDTRTLVWHAYMTHGQKIALLHSASLLRGVKNGDRALLARANRWLHWCDMLHFKEAGLRLYDWGGLCAVESNPARAGINRFKREFGGQPVCTYNCSVAVT